MKDEWCDQIDIVDDLEKYFRCTKCGRRLKPREHGYMEFAFRLPPHKKKGYKIKRKKGHNKKKKDKCG
jgi:hypothetical protein